MFELVALGVQVAVGEDAVTVDDIGIRVGLGEGLDFLERPGDDGVIRVEPHDEVAAGLEETLVDPVGHALVRLRGPLQVRVALEDFDGVVGRGGIDDDVFQVDAAPLFCEHAIDCRRQIAGVVVAGGDDREFHQRMAAGELCRELARWQLQ